MRIGKASFVPSLSIAAMLLAYPVQDGCRAQHATTQAQQRPEQKGQPVDLAPLERAINSVTSAVEALGKNPKAAEEKERADRDLKAQEKMAKWARKLYYATVLSLVLTVFGLILIARTLHHTKRAANSSAEIVEVTRDSAERQTRAYVSVKSIKLTSLLEGAVPEAAVTLINSGHSPATQICAVYGCQVGPIGQVFRIKFQNTKPTSRLALGPGIDANFSIKSSQGLSAADINAINAGRSTIVIAGAIVYKDIFQRTRRTIFKSMLPPGVKITAHTQTAVTACDKGNRMT